MKLTNIIFLVMLSFSIINCSKEGDVGPQGLQGEIGPAGENGSVIHAGTGVPVDTLGAYGDYYLDKSTNQLYGPKTEGIGWGVPIVLTGDKGDTGATGTDGSQIYAGTSLPSSTLGAEGDYYLNKTTFDLYGPKLESGWGSPINLKGMPDILYSAWIDADWNFTDNPRSKGMLIPVTQLTNQQLRNNSVVLMYLQQYGSSLLYPLPSSGRWSNTEYAYKFGGNTSTFSQNIYVTLKSTNSVDLTEYQYSAYRGNRFRYVIIPVGIAASMDKSELYELANRF
jgi:hypothetical protein